MPFLFFFNVLFLPFILFFFCFPFVSTFLVLPFQPRASGETRVDLFVSWRKRMFFLHCSPTARQLWIEHGPFPEMAHVPLKKARQCQVHKYNKQQDPKRSKGAFYLPVRVYVALKLWIVFPLSQRALWQTCYDETIMQAITCVRGELDLSIFSSWA